MGIRIFQEIYDQCVQLEWERDTTDTAQKPGNKIFITSANRLDLKTKNVNVCPSCFGFSINCLAFAGIKIGVQSEPVYFRRITASVCSLNGRETLLRLLLLLYTGSDCTPILTPANAKQLTEKPTPRRTYVYVFSSSNQDNLPR